MKGFQEVGDFEQCSEATFTLLVLTKKNMYKRESLKHVIISLFNHTKICVMLIIQKYVV